MKQYLWSQRTIKTENMKHFLNKRNKWYLVYVNVLDCLFDPLAIDSMHIEKNFRSN